MKRVATVSAFLTVGSSPDDKGIHGGMRCQGAGIRG
jgi:hypothetical protein